jgi:hypothetical protein
MQSQDNERSRKASAGVMAQASGGKAKGGRAATAKQDKGEGSSKRKVCS